MKIPIHGSMTRPGTPEEGLAELEAGKIKWDGGDLIVDVSTEEFTANCPTTGQPDFYHVKISYKPREYYVESKTMKFYLWSFRDAGMHCETLARRLGDDIKAAIDAGWVEVELSQFPRGGLKIVSRYMV